MAEKGYFSELPYDAIIKISECFLETNDLGCYVDIRGVCSNWRSTTPKPCTDLTDPKFIPSKWIMLEHSIFEDGAVTFVNLSTGRFIRKKISRVIRRYFFIAASCVHLSYLQP